ncbi:MAG: hypothetical protein M1831_003549 [Alyxoria varia]|nr:MAG: hypothetical protein M1831_003549 [Alyxoria varia]
MPGPGSRATESLDFEPVAASPSSVIDPNTARNPSFRSQKHKARIEQLGLDYLHGKPLFILSAELRGPFDSDWVNPWLERRRKSRDKGQYLPSRDTKSNHNQSEQHIIEIDSPPRKKYCHSVERNRRGVNVLKEAKLASQRPYVNGIRQSNLTPSPPKNRSPSEGLIASSQKAFDANNSCALQSRIGEANNEDTGFARSSPIQESEEKELQPKHTRDWILSTGSENAGHPVCWPEKEPPEYPQSQPEYHSLPIRPSGPLRQSEQVQHARVSKAILYDDLLELERVVSSEALKLRGNPASSVFKWHPGPHVYGGRQLGDYALRLTASPPVQRSLNFAKKSYKGTRRLIDFETLSPAVNTKPKRVAPSSAPEPRSFEVRRSPTVKDGNVVVCPDDKSGANPETQENIGNPEDQQLESPYPSTQVAIQRAHKEFQEGLRSPAKPPELSRIANADVLGPGSSSESEPKCEITPFQKINLMNKLRAVLDGEGSMINTQELFDGVSPFNVSPAKNGEEEKASFARSPTFARSMPASWSGASQASPKGDRVDAENGDCQTAQAAENSEPGLDLSEFIDEANSFLGNWNIEKAAKGACLSP